MKAVIFGVSLFLICRLSSAEEGFVLQVDPKKYSPSKFEKGLEKKVEAMPDSRSRMMPDKEYREEVFAKVPALQSHLVSLDELGRDILFLRTKTLKPSELQKFYPKIPAKTLAALKIAIQQKSK